MGRKKLEDDAFLDHGDDVLGDTDPLADEDAELFVLFAEALEPGSTKSLDEVCSEWQELFG